MSPLHVNKISLEIFNKTLARYSETAPSTLADLDRFRYDTIPAKLAGSKKDAHLLKADVEKLVEWKLKHGTFRPSLMKLVQSNPADLVKETTRLAFTPFKDDRDVMKALKTLTSLRGIGPATASLLLSVYSHDVVPFFSDELFRWTHWDASGKDLGWDRRIKYNTTEYKEVLASVEALRKRLGVKAVDAEKVAYVLGRERVGLKGESETEGDAETVVEDKLQGKKGENQGVEDAQEESRKRVQEALKEIRGEKAKEGKVKDLEEQPAKDTPKKGTKRKATDEKAPTIETRKNPRRKV